VSKLVDSEGTIYEVLDILYKDNDNCIVIIYDVKNGVLRKEDVSTFVSDYRLITNNMIYQDTELRNKYVKLLERSFKIDQRLEKKFTKMRDDSDSRKELMGFSK